MTIIESLKQRKVTTRTLQDMKEAKKKITSLTAYDALTARILDEAGIDMLLVGDSLGNVVQGQETTIPVTIDEIIYHTKAVIRGVKRSLVVADMPFMSYQVDAKEAFRNAGRLLKEAGAEAIKLEGATSIVLDSVYNMTNNGIPVLGHLGLTPQSIHKFGSYKVRGKDEEESEAIQRAAKNLEQAGACAIVLEKIPALLATSISKELSIPTIGIGAGVGCDGQILVYSDMLGLTVDFNPRFVRKYMTMYENMLSATKNYINDIEQEQFPNEKESY